MRIEAPAFPWQNVRKMGEDIVATELLFPRNHMVTPYCMGALSGGVFQVPVRRKPRVLIIPTGSELVDWRTTAPEDSEAGTGARNQRLCAGKADRSLRRQALRHDRSWTTRN